MDIVILQEKYRAVNRLTAYWDQLADWLEKRFRMAVELQKQPDAAALMDELYRIVYESEAPGPPVEFVEDELHQATLDRPDLRVEAESDVQQRHLTMQAIGLECDRIARLLEDDFASLASTARIAEEETFVAAVEQFKQQRQEAHRRIIGLLEQYVGIIARELRRTAEVGKIDRKALADQLAGSSSLKWTDLRPAERKLVKTLGEGRLAGHELAEQLHVSYSGSFKERLANLVRRKILANDNTGYHVIASFRDD
jgi:hypothetical protein